MNGRMVQEVVAPLLAVQARNLTKRFDGHPALAAVNFEAREGELVALVGENGAGKSTLLRILAGAVEPDEGDAWVRGLNIRRDRRAVARCIGTMFDAQRAWYLRLSGRTNLEYFAAVAGLDAAASRTAAQTELAAVGLAGQANDAVAGYSSGMRARLALARARLCDPPVLLLDEPTASLDERAAAEVGALLARERGRRTVISATHDGELVDALGSRVVTLEAGRVQSTRPPLRLQDEAREKHS